MNFLPSGFLHFALQFQCQRGCSPPFQGGQQPEAPQPESLAEVQPQVAYTPHAAYMFGQNGYFFPDRELTRAEAARVLVYVFDTPADAQVEFTDVAADSWFYPCVTAAENLLPGDEDGAFRPYDAVTLLEFAAAICRGTGCRLPVGSAAEVLPDAAIRYAARFGWIDADADGEQSVTRAQAVLRRPVPAEIAFLVAIF